MTAALALPRLSRFRNPRAFLVAMHLPFVAFSATQSFSGLGFDVDGLHWKALPLVFRAGLLQLRHSLAAAKGVRPRNWRWTLLLVVLIAYLPTPLFPDRWGSLQWFVIASFAMLLRGRLAAFAAVGDAMLTGIIAVVRAIPTDTPSQLVWSLVYVTTVMLAGGGALYLAARLVWHIEELRGT